MSTSCCELHVAALRTRKPVMENLGNLKQSASLPCPDVSLTSDGQYRGRVRTAHGWLSINFCRTEKYITLEAAEEAWRSLRSDYDTQVATRKAARQQGRQATYESQQHQQQEGTCLGPICNVSPTQINQQPVAPCASTVNLHSSDYMQLSPRRAPVGSEAARCTSTYAAKPHRTSVPSRQLMSKQWAQGHHPSVPGDVVQAEQPSQETAELKGPAQSRGRKRRQNVNASVAAKSRTMLHVDPAQVEQYTKAYTMGQYILGEKEGNKRCHAEQQLPQTQSLPSTGIPLKALQNGYGASTADQTGDCWQQEAKDEQGDASPRNDHGLLQPPRQPHDRWPGRQLHAVPITEVQADTMVTCHQGFASPQTVPDLQQVKGRNPGLDVATKVHDLVDVSPLVAEKPGSSQVQLHPNPTASAAPFSIAQQSAQQFLHNTHSGNDCLGADAVAVPAAHQSQAINKQVMHVPETSPATVGPSACGKAGIGAAQARHTHADPQLPSSFYGYKVALKDVYDERLQHSSCTHMELARPLGAGTFGSVQLGWALLTGHPTTRPQAPRPVLLNTHVSSSNIEEEPSTAAHHGVLLAAVKVYKTECSDFKRERHALKMLLGKPHIIQLLAVGHVAPDLNAEQDVSFPCLVLQLASGTLDDVGQPCPEHQARKWMTQLLQGLAALHAGGFGISQAQIIHRDLKPLNLLLDERNDLLIADFSCCAFGMSASADSLAVEGEAAVDGGPPMDTFVGSEMYMAPEIGHYRLGRCYDRSIDSHSVGVVALGLLLGGRKALMSRCKPVPNGASGQSLSISQFLLEVTLGYEQPQLSLSCSFRDFVAACCTPGFRLLPEQLLQHVWITEGMREC